MHFTVHCLFTLKTDTVHYVKRDLLSLLWTYLKHFDSVNRY